MYFVQFSMSQKRRKGAKFMPENEVFGQAGGGYELSNLDYADHSERRVA